MLLIDEKRYYKVNEAAKLAGVNTRTLRRWIANGNLDHFLFPFRFHAGGILYYRLEPPDDWDELFPGEDVYKLFPEEEAVKRREAAE